MRPAIPITLVVTFVTLLAVIVALLLAGLNNALNRAGYDKASRTQTVTYTAIIIIGWLAFTGWLSTLNFLNDFSVIPPRVIFVFLPPLFASVWLATNKQVTALLDFVPRHWLIWMQSYRLLIGIVFYMLFTSGVIPVEMTIAGKNYDILIGITAPLIGYLAWRKKLSNGFLTTWSITGIVLILVVAAIALLSAPFPFRKFYEAETNTMIAYFPFVFMPAFIIPLSYTLHILSLQQSLKDLITAAKKLNDKYISIIGISTVTVLIIFIFYNHLIENTFDLLFTALFTISFTWILWQGDRLIIVKIRSLYPGYQQTIKRILVQVVVITVFSTITEFLIDFLMSIYVYHSHYSYNSFYKNATIGIIISMFMLSVYESVYLFQKWKENIFETEELKHKQLQNRLDSLKNQVNPHFLFNSLSSLSVLIREDKSKATAFVQEMAQVYRYILQSNENDLTTVEKELQFVRSYMYLQRIRFDDNVKEVIEVPEEFLCYKLPSLTLQALIENAIKHNIVSTTKPLVIKINVDENDHLIVCNNLQRKMQLVQMNNFGLTNINKRYEMHGLHNPVVSESAKEFKVSLPLIPNTD